MNSKGHNDRFLVYLFGCYVFYRGGDNGDNVTGEEFCGKKSVDNLSLVSCKETALSTTSPLT